MIRASLIQRMSGHRCWWPLTAAAAIALAGCSASRPVTSTDDPRALEEASRLCNEAERAEADGNFDKANGLYKQALNLRPDLGSAWNNLGVVFQKQKNNLAAADAFRRASDLLPGDPRPTENLAHIYLGNGLDDDALRYYREALDRDPSSLAALRGMTVALKRLNRTEVLYKDHLRRALMIETDPKWREMMERQRLRIDAELRDKMDSDIGG